VLYFLMYSCLTILPILIKVGLSKSQFGGDSADGEEPGGLGLAVGEDVLVADGVEDAVLDEHAAALSII
jgi:hypothetical protein